MEHVVFSKRSCPFLEQLKIANMIRISGTEITIIDAEGLADIAEAPSLRDREFER